MPERVFSGIAPGGRLPAGRVSSAEMPVDDDVTMYSLAINRATLPSTGRICVRVHPELWLDGRWQAAGSFGLMGEIKRHHRAGTTVFFSGRHLSLPKAPGRKMRVHFEVIDPCVIQADLDLLVR